MLVDTHAHVFLDPFKDDLNEVVNRSLENDVRHIFMPNIDTSTVERMLEVERKFPGHCHPMIGLHPCSVDRNYARNLNTIEKWLGQHKFAAIGEMGTDLYWDKSYFEEQKQAFRRQAILAQEVDLPIVVHCRDSIDETIDLTRSTHKGNLKGVFHCFTGSQEQANAIIDMGFFLGIGGIVTFKKSALGEIIEAIDLQHIVIETDSPYLAPTPNRGKRNEPANVKHIAEKIAEIKGISSEQVGRITSRNAMKLYGEFGR